MHGRYKIAQHAIYRILVKNPEIAVSQQIHLDGLQFQAELFRLVLECNRAVIGQAGFGTDGGVLRKSNSDFVTGEMVGPGLQFWKLGIHTAARMNGSIVGHQNSFLTTFYTRGVAERNFWTVRGSNLAPRGAFMYSADENR